MSKISLKKISESDHQIWNETCYSIEKVEFDRIIQRIIKEEGEGRTYSFWIWCEDSNQAVGFTQLFNVLSYPAHSATIEIAVAPKFQRRAFAYLGLELLQKFAFEELGLLKLVAPIRPDNLPSIKLFSKLSYEKLADDPYAFFFKNKPEFCLIYAKLSPRVMR